MDKIQELRLQAKSELAEFNDKRYLNSLKAINEISHEVTDHLIYVYQLIKEKEFELALQYYSTQLRPSYREAIKNLLTQNSQLAMCCEDFYKWSCISQLQQYLNIEKPKVDMDREQSERAQSFIDQVYNLSQFYQMSGRQDHRPSYIAYPDLNDSPFIQVKLKDKTLDQGKLIDLIKTQVLKILEKQPGKPYVKQVQGIPPGLEHLAGNNDWRSVVLYEAGQLKVDAAAKLISILENNFDLADCAPMAPEVMISILEPGTHITPHYGTSNIKHTLHIPILLPKGDLGIVVGGEKKIWQEDQCLLFDDSYLHEAWNKSDHTRIVLIVDLWHHNLSFAEKTFLRNVMPAIVEAGQSLIL